MNNGRFPKSGIKVLKDGTQIPFKYRYSTVPTSEINQIIPGLFLNSSNSVIDTPFNLEWKPNEKVIVNGLEFQIASIVPMMTKRSMTSSFVHRDEYIYTLYIKR